MWFGASDSHRPPTRYAELLCDTLAPVRYAGPLCDMQIPYAIHRYAPLQKDDNA